MGHIERESQPMRSGTALVEIEDLHVTFPHPAGPIKAVQGLTLRVEPGQMVALVGESGSGKSVAARTLVGLTGGKAQVSARRLALSGRDVSSLSEKQWRKVRGHEIGFVLQDALVSLNPLRTIGREVAEPLLTHGLEKRATVLPRVHDLLRSVGVPQPEDRAKQYPHQLSGGLRQRALIASALAAGPDVIIADEPTTALDVTVQKQVMQLLSDLAAQGKGVLLITHDLAVVAELADYIHVMRFGEIVESGSTASVLSDPQHAYTRQLLAAVPSAATKGQPLYIGPGVSEVRPESVPSPREIPVGDPIFEVKDVTVRYTLPGGSELLAADAVSFDVPRGSTLGIVGESGSGKSTVGRVIMALQQPTEGEVLFNGSAWSTLRESDRRGMRSRVQVISQDPFGSFDPQFTVERLIRQPLRLHTELDAREQRDEAARLLALVGLDDRYLSRRPHEMSGGQRQRVAIARALASSPELLLCDEAVSALDVSTQAQVLDLLVDLRDRLGLTVIFISHDIGVVHHMSDLVVVMKSGRIVEHGDIDSVFFDPQDDYTKMLLASVPSLELRTG